MQNFFKRYIQGDYVVWIVFVALSLISIVEIYSAGSFFVNNKDNYASELFRHVGFLSVGALAALSIHRMNYKWTRLFIYLLLPLSFLMLTILVFIPSGFDLKIGGFTLLGTVSENEASRWMIFLGIKFQPSELAKISVITFLADLYSKNPLKSFTINAFAKLFKKELNEKTSVSIKFWFGVAVLAIFSGLIAFDNLSTGVLLFGVGFLMMIIAKQPWLKIGLLSIILIGFIGMGYLAIDNVSGETLDKIGLSRAKTWVNRINSFVNNKGNAKYAYTRETAQVAHAQIAIARGGFFGVMPGNSVERDYLPQAFSDFIYAIIVEEIGIFGGIIVILLYLILLYRAGIIAKKSNKDYHAILVLGLTLMIILQAFISIAVAAHLGPVTGQPLPLLSRGGTSVIITCMYIGIIQCIARNINEENQKELAVNEETQEASNNIEKVRIETENPETI
jgi:cell division protein FtsW